MGVERRISPHRPMAAGWGLMEAGGAIIGANLRELASTSPHQEEGMRVMGARTEKLAST